MKVGDLVRLKGFAHVVGLVMVAPKYGEMGQRSGWVLFGKNDKPQLVPDHLVDVINR